MRIYTLHNHMLGRYELPIKDFVKFNNAEFHPKRKKPKYYQKKRS